MAFALGHSSMKVLCREKHLLCLQKLMHVNTVSVMDLAHLGMFQIYLRLGHPNTLISGLQID